MRGRRILGWARPLPALVIWAAGCEMLVDGKLGEVHCAQEGVVGPPACPAGLLCKDTLCVPTVLGTPCAADADCAAGDFCLDPAIVGGDGPRRCSRACCDSGDCDPDALFVCWSAPRGAGGFCRSASEVGRAEGGARPALAACARDTECRSGLCRSGRCADTCCSDTACAAGGGACGFGASPDAEAPGFWCGAPPLDKKPRYALCAADAECATGLCVDFSPSHDKRCSTPCCASSECETSPDKGTPVACAPVLVGGTWVRACSLLVLGDATAEVGGACAADGDCRSGFCAEQSGRRRCSDACCSDASCGDPSAFACRPVAQRASWALRCEPK